MKGHEVTVFCLPRTAAAFKPPEGVRLQPVLPRWTLYSEYPVVAFSMAAFAALLKEHRNSPFDVSHAMNLNNFGLPFHLRAMRRLGLPHVSTGFETTGMDLRAKCREFVRCPDLHCLAQIAVESLLAPWQRAYIGWADGITTEDVETRAGFAGLGIDPERISLIPSGVDLRGLATFPKDESLESALRTKGSPLLFCPGRIDPRKGAQFLVRAFAGLLPGHPAAHLVLAGGGRGTFIEKIKDLAAGLGLGGKITFAGQVESFVPYYRACDRVIIPSLSEGIPITLQEALALSRPVVCSRLEGTFHFAGKLPSISWAKPGDEADLLRALRESLKPVPDESLETAKRFMNDYDWSAVADRYLEVYALAAERLKGRRRQ